MHDREPVEIILIAVPILCEAIAVLLFIAAGAMGIMLMAQRVPV